MSPTAYAPKELDDWAARAKLWAEGGQPDDLPYADPAHKAKKTPRDVFVYIIHEGKIRAPQRRHGADGEAWSATKATL